jgi:hypothetical protein
MGGLLYFLALLRTNKAPLDSLFWAVLGARGIDAPNVRVNALKSEKNQKKSSTGTKFHVSPQ